MRTLYLLKVDPPIRDSVTSESPFSAPLTTHILESSDQAVIEANKLGSNGSVMVLGSTLPQPIQTLQRLHTINPDLSVIVLCDEIKCSDLKKSIQFTPFIGRHVQCISISNAASASAEIRAALQRAEKRQKYLLALNQANRSLLDSEHFERQETENAKQVFFDRLLDSAPIGIASVDVDGRVLSWNVGAQAISEKTELAMLGKPFTDLFENAETCRSLKLIFARATSPIDFRTTPIVFSRFKTAPSDPEQHLEVTVASITGRYADRGSVVLFQDVTDRVNANLERKKKETLLEEAVKSRDEFLSIASHELKTPLTPLKLHLQKLSLLVRRNKFSEITPQKLIQVVDIADKQITRISTLIEDLLDVSRINLGKFSLNIEEFDLSALCGEVTEGFTAQAQANQIQLISQLERGVLIRADRVRIEQVLSNLLTNAFKFAEGKPVMLLLETDTTFVSVKVIDHGIGVAEKDLNRIFLKYERVENPGGTVGLGLGLFISKQIAEAHAGSLSIDSKLGNGSTFKLKLPLTA